MNDESPDLHELLASSAFDGVATADELAQAETSPVAREQIAFYVRLRSQLVDVEVPQAARTAAIGAALAAFDNGESTEEAPIAPVVSMHERRRRQWRWIGGAAAAVVVAVAIGVVARGGGEDNNTASEQASSFSVSTKQQVEVAGTVAAADSATAAAASGSGGGGGETATTIEASSAASTPNLPPLVAPAAVSPWIDAPALATPDQVAAFAKSNAFDQSLSSATGGTAAAATSAAPAQPVSTAPFENTDQARGNSAEIVAQCGLDSAEPSALAIYLGQDVVIIRDDAAHEALVLAPDTCRVVTEVALD